MAALIELLLHGEICPRDLIRWLDGASVEGILEDLQPLRVEFVPVFLNFLRDQSSGVLQVGLPSGFTPNKAPSSVRATKYISPGKDPSFRNRARKQPLSSKAKTLHFSDTPVKTRPLTSVEEAKTPDLDKLLRQSDSALTVSLHSSPPHGRRQNFGLNFSTPNLHNSNKHGWNSTSTPRNNSYAGGSRSESPLSHERPQKGKRQSLEGSDSWGKFGHSSEVKHSEQRPSLGDFITADVKWATKRKSPLPRESSSRSAGRPVRHHEVPKTLDLSDQEAFPMVGSTPTQDKQSKRRINPTRITTNSSRQAVKAIAFSQSSKAGFGGLQSPSSPFLTSEEGGTKSMEEERELLRQERMKRQENSSSAGGGGGGPGKPLGRESPPQAMHEKLDYVEVSPDKVTNRTVVDALVQTYAELILFNMAPSIMVELYYLVQLLTVRTLASIEEPDSQQREIYLGTIHNCVYFATNVLLTVVELVKLLDKATIRFLSENPRVTMFSVDLQKCLSEFLDCPPPAPMRNQAPKSPIGSVSFQSDTDNRNNFPNDQAFHVFRKQRDMFYEMIRIWEENHLMSGWSYAQALGAKIKQLLTLRPDPINFAHFARLFQSQLLTMCRGDDDQHISNEDTDGLGFLTLLKKQQPEKYKRLYERLVTPSRLGGPCPCPSFPGSQEFFREFILTASNLTFNQHLKDALISQILDLNDQEFVILEPEEGDPIDNMVKEEARSVVLNLRLLAKFLGFLEFLPYQTSEHLPENVMATQISLRAKVYPPLNVNAALRQCMSSGRLVVGVTWVVEFLSMVDPVALHSQHYLTVVMTLIAIFKLLYIGRQQCSVGCVLCQAQAGKKTLSPTNSLLLKLLLGWLFDQPNFPAGLFFTDVSEADIDRREYSQNIEVLNKNYCHFCISCLRQMLIVGAQRSDSFQECAAVSEGIERLSLREVSPTKNFSPRKGITNALTKTPSKELPKGMSISPMKTPSKFLTITMLESPQTTPLKVNESEDVTERSVYLDLSDFVDHQMITICCPFICELKHLLSEFWLGVTSKKNTNSYRKITPLSASDKTPSVMTQKQLQMQLEDNFFHNNPSSVRKTTEFVIERVSSNVIKKIRSKMIPDLKEKALEQLKTTIDGRMKNSPQTLERTRDAVQKQVTDLSQEMSHQIRAQCTQMAQQECQSEVLSSLTFLMPPDMTEQALDVCRKIVSRSCQEKVTAWVQSHLTPVLFSKDLSADGDRLLRQAQKAADFQATALQNSLNDTSISNLDMSEASANLGTENSFTGNHSGLSITDFPLNSPTNHPNKLCSLPKKPATVIETLPVTATEHDDSLPAPSKVIMDIKEMVRLAVRSDADRETKVGDESICVLLHNIREILTRRQDITLTVWRALESLTVDLAFALVACLPDRMTPKIQEIFLLLWQPVEKNGVIPVPSGLTSSLSPRTVMLVGQNPNASQQQASWAKMESLLTALLINKLLTPASLQDQCVALLRHSWPQEILNGLSSCIEGVSRQAQKNKDLRDDLTLVQLLEWVSWVCGQMEDFPDIL